MSIASRVLSLHEAAQLHRPERALLTLSLLAALLLHAVLAGAWPSLTRLAENARAAQEPEPPREPEQMQYIILPDTIEKDEEVIPDAAIAQARNSQQARQKDDSPELPEGGPTSEGISKVSTQTVDSTPAVPLSPPPTPPTPPSPEPSPAATPTQPTPPSPAVHPAQPTPQAQPLSALPPQAVTPPEVTEQTPVPETLAPLGDEAVTQIPKQKIKEPPVAPKEQPKPETKPDQQQEQRPRQEQAQQKNQNQQQQQPRQPTPPQPQATPAPRTPPPVKKIGPQETPREKQTAVTRKTRARVGGDNSLMLLKSRYGAYMDKVIKRLEEAVRRAESMGIMATQRGVIRTSFKISPTGDLIEAKILEAPAEMLREQNIVRMIYEDARAQGLFDPPSDSMQKDPDFNPIIVSFWFE